MKYIKYFEEKVNFSKGDYIILSPIFNLYSVAQIISDNKGDEFDIIGILNDRIYNTYVYIKEIVRKATPEEIEDFNIKLKTIKYNI